MNHPLLVLSTNGNGSRQNQNQTCTKQPNTTTRQKETIPITQEFEPNNSFKTAEMVSSNDTLQAALRPSTVLKFKTYQTKWDNCCMQNNILQEQPKIS